MLIPNGTFQMGLPIEEEKAANDEWQHQVTISKDYYLGVMEVTQGQYAKVMRTNLSHFQKRVICKSDSSMYPVETVSWEDAVEFCNKLSDLPEEKKAGRVYCLPTEAEWKYARRACGFIPMACASQERQHFYGPTIAAFSDRPRAEQTILVRRNWRLTWSTQGFKEQFGAAAGGKWAFAGTVALARQQQKIKLLVGAHKGIDHAQGACRIDIGVELANSEQ